MSLQEIEAWLKSKAKDAVDEWFIQQIHHPYESYFLYFKRGDIRVSNEPLEGYELASGQRISPAWSSAQAYQYIIDISRKIPCLPE